MKFILGKKLGMSQMFDKDGKVIPVTLIEAGPCFVAQIKKNDNDGYEAIQFGFGSMGKKKVKKTAKGKEYKYLREFKSANESEMNVGDKIDVSVLEEGDIVKVIGVSKGKGFAGVVKRHGFKGGPASHGQKDRLRAPGSIGMSFPERVPKGRRMAGRMGSDRVTTRNLRVAAVDAVNNLLAIKGALPGNNGGLIEIIGE